jgi:hypothetical protein
MLKNISIRGLGPHSEFSAEFNPRGTTIVSGASEVGKSMLVDAVLFALWGRRVGGRFAPEAIREGHDKVVVELTLDSGLVVRRSMTRSRSVTRSITIGSQREVHATEDAFAKALEKLGADSEALRLVIAPLEGIPLVAANARAFRDVLTRILPTGDTEAVLRSLMTDRGFNLRPGEGAMTEKGVLKARRDARSARDRATGRIAAAEERIGGLERQQLDDDGTSGTDAAKVVMAAFEAWDAHARAARGADARILGLKNQIDWDRRHTALGDRPEYTAGSFEEADRAEKDARRLLKTAMQAYTEVDLQHQAANARLKELNLAGPDVCPTCERPGWTAGEAALSEQEKAVGSLRTAVDVALETGRSRRTAHNTARKAMDAARDAKGQAETWESSLAALGARPVVPPEPADGPDAPSATCPTDAEVTQARAVLDQARAAEGARQQRARDLDDAREALGTARKAHAAVEADEERYSALLDCVRAAPSMVAARQAEALGDLGPVTLEFGDNPAVTVLIDGRPWWLASRGRRVVADTWLRAALRRAMNLPWLPIFVDNSQDFGGQDIPDIGGPVIILTTTHATTITVVRRRTTSGTL